MSSIYEQAKGALGELGASAQYPHILEKIILQGLIKLMEDKVLINVRAEDLQIAKDVVGSAVADFEAATGIKVCPRPCDDDDVY